MYATREIRWFLQEEIPAAEAWFARHHLYLNAHAARRTDWYLPQPGRSDNGTKLREGEIEVKQRTGPPAAWQATPQAVGWLENWEKWSFRLPARGPQARQILSGSTDWLAVQKERIGLKISVQKNGNYRFYPLKTSLASGLQVEYTRLQVHTQTWYTVALEAFGHHPPPLAETLAGQLLGPAHLPAEASLSYPGWLRPFFA